MGAFNDATLPRGLPPRHPQSGPADLELEEWDEDHEEGHRSLSDEASSDSGTGSDSSTQVETSSSDTEADDETASQSSRSSMNSCSTRTSMSRRVSIPKNMHLTKTVSQITEEGAKEVAKIYEEFELPVPEDDEKWQKALRAFQRDFEIVNKCCGSSTKQSLPQHAHLRSDTQFYTNVFNFIRTRFTWKKEFKFDRKKIKMMVQKQGAMLHAEWSFDGWKMCDACYTSMIGVSRTTMCTWQKPEFNELTSEKKRKSYVKDRLVWFIEGMITNGEAQSLPDKTGSDANGKPKYIFNFADMEMLRRHIETRLRWSEDAPSLKISPSTLRRAKIKVEEKNKYIIEARKWKGLARCKDCESLQNALKEAKRARNALGIEQFTRLLKDHNEEWREQRSFFDQQKRLALESPWQIWCLTCDGMDQAKTRLPSYPRLTKDKETENKLDTRVTGGMIFGGPVPVTAVTSFSNIHAKGGSASITAIDAMLDVQYRKMDPNRIAPIPDLNLKIPKPRSKIANPLVDPAAIAALEEKKVEELDPALHEDEHVESKHWQGVDPESKVEFMWPEGLHITFDNTASDCKNAHCFNYFGQLVAAGVFKHITVSTLIVGHTHDIVDQMFSVWAFRLKKQAAPSLSKLHKVFKKNYATQIYARDDIIGRPRKRSSSFARSKSEPKLSRAPSKVSSNASVASAQSNHTSLRHVRGNIAVHPHLLNIAETIGVQPHMMHQEYTIEAEGWCHNKTIESITKPHIFHICQEMSDDPDPSKREMVVNMYSRHLAQSHVENKDQIIYRYADVRNGPYSSKYTLLKVKDLILTNPRLKPPCAVDTAPVRRCLNVHYKTYEEQGEGRMSKEEYDEMNGWLDKFDNELSEMAVRCETCHKYAVEIQKIGTIHRPQDSMSDEEKERLKKKEREKHKLKRDWNTHLGDPLFEVEHEPMRMDDVYEEVQEAGVTIRKLVREGFWTKWLRRVKDVIRPYYISRNLVANPTPEQLAMSGRTPHPTSLPGSHHARSAAGAINGDLLQRRNIPEEWRRQDGHDYPAIGDIVIFRSNEAQNPYWLGEVTDTFGFKDQSEESEEIPTAAAAASSTAAAAASIMPAAASNSSPAAAAGSSTTPLEACRRSTRASNLVVKTRVSKMVNESKDGEEEELQEEEKEESATPVARRTRRRRRDESEEEASEPSEDEDEDSDPEGDEPLGNFVEEREAPSAKRRKKNVQPKKSQSKKNQPKKRKSRAENSDEEEFELSNLESKKAKGRGKKSRSKATSSEEEEPRPTEGRHVQVRWWQYVETPAAELLRLHSVDLAGVAIEQHLIQTKSSARKLDTTAVKPWKDALKRYSKGEHGRLPPFVVERMKDLTFAPATDPAWLKLEWRDYDTCIIWDTPENLLKTRTGGLGRALKASHFKLVLEDLTEISEARNGIPERASMAPPSPASASAPVSAAAAVAAAASEPSPMDIQL